MTKRGQLREPNARRAGGEHNGGEVSPAMSRPAPDLVALGRAVLAIRTERGMSQVQLAQATRFRQAWLSTVEHGRRNPSWSNIVRLSEGLGVKTSTLVRRAERLAEGSD